MKTRRGIYTDLSESTYFSEYSSFLFYFSSKLYKEKFDKLVKENLGIEYNKF